jgi:hypothetical protein
MMTAWSDVRWRTLRMPKPAETGAGPVCARMGMSPIRMRPRAPGPLQARWCRLWLRPVGSPGPGNPGPAGGGGGGGWSGSEPVVPAAVVAGGLPGGPASCVLALGGRIAPYPPGTDRGRCGREAPGALARSPSRSRGRLQFSGPLPPAVGTNLRE